MVLSFSGKCIGGEKLPSKKNQDETNQSYSEATETPILETPACDRGILQPFFLLLAEFKAEVLFRFHLKNNWLNLFWFEICREIFCMKNKLFNWFILKEKSCFEI